MGFGKAVGGGRTVDYGRRAVWRLGGTGMPARRRADRYVVGSIGIVSAPETPVSTPRHIDMPAGTAWYGRGSMTGMVRHSSRARYGRSFRQIRHGTPGSSGRQSMAWQGAQGYSRVQQKGQEKGVIGRKLTCPAAYRSWHNSQGICSGALCSGTRKPAQSVQSTGESRDMPSFFRRGLIRHWC